MLLRLSSQTATTRGRHVVTYNNLTCELTVAHRLSYC